MKPKNTNTDTESKFRKTLKKIPLDIRLKVSNEMAFISLLTELGFRENKSWGEDENPLLSKLCKFAEEHTKNQLETIEEWKADGEPK